MSEEHNDRALKLIRVNKLNGLAVIDHGTPETGKARPLLVRKLSERSSEARETHNRTR